MTEQLKSAIEGLYGTFSGYLVPQRMDGCPCCVSLSDKDKIHLKSLKDLSADDISHYASKAMTTWGNVDDFKHYLPRIFELMLDDDFYPDAFVVLGKLEYGLWETWSDNEQQAIKTFLLEWWNYLLITKDRFDEDRFMEIAKKTGVKPLLDSWQINLNGPGFKIFVHFIFDHFQVYLYHPGKEISLEVMKDISIWLKANEGLLEQGYYDYEKSEPDFAQTISYAYDIVRQIK